MARFACHSHHLPSYFGVAPAGAMSLFRHKKPGLRSLCFPKKRHRLFFNEELRMKKTMAPLVGERGTRPPFSRFGTVFLDWEEMMKPVTRPLRSKRVQPMISSSKSSYNDANLKVFFEKPINLDRLWLRRQEAAGFEGILADVVDF